MVKRTVSIQVLITKQDARRLDAIRNRLRMPCARAAYVRAALLERLNVDAKVQEGDRDAVHVPVAV